MKKYFYQLTLLLFSSLFFVACNNDDDPVDEFPSEQIEGCYIVNYGSFGNGGASISKYDYKKDEMTNFYYQAQNNGTELLSNIQFAYENNDQVFLLGNETDQIINLNPLFEQTINGVTEDIEKPRFCVASGDYLYISCLGTNPDWDEMPDTYIAKYNLLTKMVEKRIPMPGGPEGLAISKGKLYVALNYNNQIAVVQLDDDSVSYITLPAVSSYFVKDRDGNLYCTLLSTFSDFSDETGIAFINTSNDQMETYYTLENVSSGYGSMIQADKFFSKIYVVTSAYDANWNLTGAVSVFDVAGKSFNNTPFVSDVPGISGVSVNPINDDVYVYSGQSVTGIGQMSIYDKEGNSKNDYEVGASPNGAIFLD